MAYQIHLPSHLQHTQGDGEPDSKRDSARAQLAPLFAERDRLHARWEKGLDFLDGLRERQGQDGPEYDRYFAEWKKIGADLCGVLDKIEFAEMTARIREQGSMTPLPRARAERGSLATVT